MKQQDAQSPRMQDVRGAKAKNEVLSSSITPTPQAVKSITPSVYLGAWTDGFFNPSTNTLNVDALRLLQNVIGKKLAIAHYYRGWHTLDSSEFLNELELISSNGWRPMISANPYFFERCQANGVSLYKAISNGNCDEFLHSIGRNFMKFGKPVFFRFAWEMNIDSMEWSVTRTGEGGFDFILAWQRIHEIFYQENATNVLFVFSPNVGGVIPYKDIYPGNEFVDWVALDGYNWGTTQSWSRWESFSNVFSSSYYNLLAVAPNKPMMIAETNTTDKGGNKAFWYDSALLNEIPINFPRIKALVIYNEDRSAKENVNWLIDISKSSLDAFKNGISSGYYISSF